MDYKELVQLVKQGEGLRTEFKLKTNHPDKIIREIVAFANTAGGWLLVGVDDAGVIKGLKNSEGDRYVLDKAIATLCFPEITYTTERIKVGEEKEVLVYYIHHSNQKPHCITTEEGKRRAYIRVADKSVQASREMYQIMKQAGRQRNVQFVYGEKERLLMQLLEEKERITVQDYVEFANLSTNVASKTLILLVLANVLEIHPTENRDWYSRLEVEY